MADLGRGALQMTDARSTALQDKTISLRGSHALGFDISYLRSKPYVFFKGE
jgi:hypothetical protein